MNNLMANIDHKFHHKLFSTDSLDVNNQSDGYPKFTQVCIL